MLKVIIIVDTQTFHVIVFLRYTAFYEDNGFETVDMTRNNRHEPSTDGSTRPKKGKKAKKARRLKKKEGSETEADVCLMYVSCMSYVCLMYVSCMSHVCLMYVLCMSHVYVSFN